MSSRTSLGQRNELKAVRSSIGSSFNLSNQLSSRRLVMQFPIQTFININDQLNTIHIYEKYSRFADSPKPEKDTYKGQLKNGKKEGFGTYTLKNNDQYTGYWDQDKMHGMGIYIFDNPNSSQRYVYIGEFSQGKFNGIGKLIFLHDKNDKQGYVVFQGFWQNGQKNGYGVYFYSEDTSVYYEGYWQNDMKNGQGRLLFKNGQFSGYWNNDMKHGQGKLRIQNSDRCLIYEGQWINDELNEGQITYLTPSPECQKQGSYKGQIRNGKKDGQGTFEFNNIFMKGTFDNDYFTGKGVLYNNHYKIEGDFLNPKSPLKGTIKYSNGDVFEGIIDIASGLIRRKEGEYKFKNGDLAKGKFDDKGSGNLIGFFEYLWSNGEVKKFDN